MLQQLRLGGCHIGLQPGRLLLDLELGDVALEEEQFGVLPQLPHLTSLAIEDMEVAWPAVLQCSHLQKLDLLGDLPDPTPLHLPPGSLPQLTRLKLITMHESPAWVALPQLRSLEVLLRG